MVKRKSKYLGKMFLGGWTCVYVGIDSVQSMKAKRPAHRSYYYIMQRRTSDNLADKFIRLNRNEAAKVWQYKVTVEEILNKREAKQQGDFNHMTSYHFC